MPATTRTPKTPLRRTRSFDGHSDSYSSDGGGGRPAFLSFRARQFNVTPEAIDGISPRELKLGTHNPNQARPTWSPSPTRDTPNGAELQTPVLCPDETTTNVSTNLSFVSNDTPCSSVRAPRAKPRSPSRNGQVLVNKIRTLQRKLEESENENNTMKTQIKQIQEKQEIQEKQFQQVQEEHDRRLSTHTTHMEVDEQDESISSNHSADETIIQDAMTQIQSGVNQLERSLRRLSRSGSLVGSTIGSTVGSFQKQYDLGRSTQSTQSSRSRSSSAANSTAATETNGAARSSTATATHLQLQGDVVCGHGTPSWWSRLQCGDMVDGRDKDRVWYVARVASIEQCHTSSSDRKRNTRRRRRRRSSGAATEEMDNQDQEEDDFRVLISFDGWSSDWDIWVHSESDIAELAPRGTHVDVTTHRTAEEEEKAENRARGGPTFDMEMDNANNVSLIPAEEEDEEDGVNLSRGSTQVGGTPEQQRSMNSWGGDSLSPVEYVQSLGGSSRIENSEPQSCSQSKRRSGRSSSSESMHRKKLSMLRHEIMILPDGGGRDELKWRVE